MQKSREEINKARSGFNKRKIKPNVLSAFTRPPPGALRQEMDFAGFRESEEMTAS
jgi:hypothetical protein